MERKRKTKLEDQKKSPWSKITPKKEKKKKIKREDTRRQVKSLSSNLFGNISPPFSKEELIFKNTEFFYQNGKEYYLWVLVSCNKMKKC